MAKRKQTAPRWIAEVRAAREAGPVVYFEFYCDNQSPGCIAREVLVKVKDYDGIVTGELAKAPQCPLCGQPLKWHWVRSMEQHARAEEHEARVSVNYQIYRRDHADPQTGMLLVPSTEMMNDALPELAGRRKASRAQ